MFSRVLANGHRSSATPQTLRPGKTEFKSAPNMQISQVSFFFISDQGTLHLIFEAQGKARFADAAALQTRCRSWRTLLSFTKLQREVERVCCGAWPLAGAESVILR